MKRIIFGLLLITGLSAAADPAFADASQAIDEISIPGYVWQTGSSIAAKKQFWKDMVFNYAGGQDDPWFYELISVTQMNGISEYPGNGIKYIYYLNNGIKYYMYDDDNTFLECHWDPDGYSVSDSLIRTGDNVTENTELINLGTYDGSTCTFELNSISVFTGYDVLGEREICLSANLKSPVQLRTSDGDVILHSIQIFGDPVDELCRNRNVNLDFEGYDGYSVENTTDLVISGELIEAHTAHHHTPVIMHVTDIRG